MVFNWKRAGRIFRELLLQERRGIMEYCNGCGKDISCQQEKKRRRLLSSTGLRPVLHTLKKFYSDLTQESMEELLPGGFICRSCVGVSGCCYSNIHISVGRSHREEFRPTRQSIRARKLYNETAVKYYIPAEPDGCGQLTRPFGAEQLGKGSGARD